VCTGLRFQASGKRSQMTTPSIIPPETPINMLCCCRVTVGHNPAATPPKPAPLTPTKKPRRAAKKTRTNLLPPFIFHLIHGLRQDMLRLERGE
jgi:hypothetical protein